MDFKVADWGKLGECHNYDFPVVSFFEKVEHNSINFIKGEDMKIPKMDVKGHDDIQKYINTYIVPFIENHNDLREDFIVKLKEGVVFKKNYVVKRNDGSIPVNSFDAGFIEACDQMLDTLDTLMENKG